MFWHSDDEEIKGQARESNANADEGVDGITVKRYGHQEDGAEAEDNGKEKTELEGTRPIRLLPAQIKLTDDREPHEEPVAEAVVVNELKDVLHTQVDQCHDTIEEQSRYWCEPLNMNHADGIREMAFS